MRRPEAVVVILGAKLLPGSLPSPAMIRRVNAALALTHCYPGLILMPSGGVVEERIVIEPRPRNTFENVLYSARLLAEELSPGTIVIC